MQGKLKNNMAKILNTGKFPYQTVFCKLLKFIIPMK